MKNVQKVQKNTCCLRTAWIYRVSIFRHLLRKRNSSTTILVLRYRNLYSYSGKYGLTSISVNGNRCSLYSCNLHIYNGD